LKTYDALCIFDEKLDGEALDGVLARIGSELTRLGGAIEHTDNAGRHAFARQMGRRTHGLYVWLTLRLPPEQVAPLRIRLKLIEEIVRVQIEHARPRPEPAPDADGGPPAPDTATEPEKEESDGKS
jgi:ribosomal protein S6